MKLKNYVSSLCVFGLVSTIFMGSALATPPPDTPKTRNPKCNEYNLYCNRKLKSQKRKPEHSKYTPPVRFLEITYELFELYGLVPGGGPMGVSINVETVVWALDSKKQRLFKVYIDKPNWLKEMSEFLICLDDSQYIDYFERGGYLDRNKLVEILYKYKFNDLDMPGFNYKYNAPETVSKDFDYITKSLEYLEPYNEEVPLSLTYAASF